MNDTATAGKVASSSVILMTEAVVRLVAVAAISFWIARALGPAQFGILNFASALVAICLGIADLGMEVPVILRLATAREPGSVMGTVLFIRAAGSVMAFLLAVGLAFALQHDNHATLIPTLIVSLGILAAIPHELDYWFKARTAAAAPALARTISTVTSAAIKAGCLMLGLTVIALAWTTVLEAALIGLGLLWAFRWSSKGSAADALSFDRRRIRPLMREALPYFYSGVAVLAYLKIDLVMLGYLSTTVETGIYGLAQKLSEVIYVVPVMLIASAFPSLARRFKTVPSRGRQSEQMLFDLAVGGATVAVLVANLLAKPVIEALFGPSYEPAINIFHLHSLSCLAIAMNEARYRWMAAVSLQGFAPIVTSMGLVINIGMNLILIPMLGAKGAAITTVVSYFISGYATSFLFAPLRGLGLAQTRALWPWGRLYGAAREWRSERALGLAR